MSPEASYLIFQLRRQPFGLPLSDIKEVCSLPALHRPPGLPPLLAGFASLGDTLLPVLELAWLMDFPPQAHHIDQHLILLRRQPLFCLVDRVLDIATLPPAAPLQDLHTFNNWVSGTLTYQQTDCALLDSERLLLSEERQRLSSLQAMVSQRLQALEPDSDDSLTDSTHFKEPNISL